MASGKREAQPGSKHLGVQDELAIVFVSTKRSVEDINALSLEFLTSRRPAHHPASPKQQAHPHPKQSSTCQCGLRRRSPDSWLGIATASPRSMVTRRAAAPGVGAMVLAVAAAEAAARWWFWYCLWLS